MAMHLDFKLSFLVFIFTFIFGIKIIFLKHKNCSDKVFLSKLHLISQKRKIQIFNYVF